MAENIVESFTEYLDCLKDEYQPHLLYRGEFLARHLYSTIEETNNWIVWENKGGIEICKVNKQDNYIFISAIYCLPNRRTRQTLWSAVQMLTQKLCCQTIHDCPKVVPLHYESE